MYIKSLTIILLLFCLSFNSITFSKNKNKKTRFKNIPQLSSDKVLNDYDQYWRQIDSLDAHKMTLTAKKISETIYSLALNEKNEKQALKALIVKLSYENILDDKNVKLVFSELREAIKIFNFPERNIIQSALARKYYEYWGNTYYKSRGRSVIENDTSQDFETWSLNRLRREADMLFTASLENSNALKKIASSEYSEFILKGNIFGYNFHPTLYDMLCHQELKAYSGYLYSIDKFDVVFPADSIAFGTPEEFLRVTENDSDSILIKNKVIKLFTDLTLFHINDSLKAEITDISLKRLEYFYQNFNTDLKDSIYVRTLNHMLKEYDDTLSIPAILSSLADYYYRQLPRRSNDKNRDWYWKKALELCSRTIIEYPGSFGAIKAESIKSDILRKTLHLRIENAVLPDEPFRALLSCANINKVYFRIAESISSENDTIFKDESSVITYYRSIKPYAEFSQLLPEKGDYLYHEYDVVFPKLPSGRYTIIASTDSSFTKRDSLTLYKNIYVTNLSAVTRTENGRKEFFIVHRKSGRPLKDIIIRIFEKQNSGGAYFIQDLKTDDDGFASAVIPNGNLKVLLSSGKDIYEFEYFSYDQYKLCSFLTETFIVPHKPYTLRDSHMCTIKKPANMK